MGKTRAHTCETCGVTYEIAADLLGTPSHGDRCFRALVDEMKDLQKVVKDLRMRNFRVK